MESTERPVAVVDDPRFDEHRSRGYHPERPERLEAARSGLHGTIPPALRWLVPARTARSAEAQKVHGEGYIRGLERALARGWGQLDPDTYFGPGTHEAAWAAAGGAIDMVEALRTGKARRGIALLRPPGHHARPDLAMGFCLLNNLAIAAAAALEQGVQRLAIVDWDVHHGNGTQEHFYDDPRVLFISIHQWPFFPGTGPAEEIGSGEGRGLNINLPLPGGTGPEIYGEAFRRLVLPALDAFGAELTLVSTGFDGHARDPLAGLELDSSIYGAMTTAVLDQAERAGHGRVGLVLEGGYDLQAIESSMNAVGRALLGERTELPHGKPRAVEREALETTLARIRPHWSGDPFAPA